MRPCGWKWSLGLCGRQDPGWRMGWPLPGATRPAPTSSSAERERGIMPSQATTSLPLLGCDGFEGWSPNISCFHPDSSQPPWKVGKVVWLTSTLTWGRKWRHPALGKSFLSQCPLSHGIFFLREPGSQGSEVVAGPEAEMQPLPEWTTSSWEPLRSGSCLLPQWNFPVLVALKSRLTKLETPDVKSGKHPCFLSSSSL